MLLPVCSLSPWGVTSHSDGPLTTTEKDRIFVSLQKKETDRQNDPPRNFLTHLRPPKPERDMAPVPSAHLEQVGFSFAASPGHPVS